MNLMVTPAGPINTRICAELSSRGYAGAINAKLTQWAAAGLPTA
jgi:hypothetical protein